MNSLKNGTLVEFEVPDGTRKFLKITRFITSGGEAEVYAACDPMKPSDEYCVKYLCGSYIRYPQAIHRKLAILAQYRSRFPEEFVMPLGVSRIFKGNGILYYMPLLEGYKKLSKIIISPDEYSLKFKLDLTKRVAAAFRKLADLGYNYTDISDSNIMYKFVGNEISIKIIDAEGILPDKKAASTIEGTGYYRAPEVILGKQPTIQSDIHAFSVLAFRIFCGRHPLDTEVVRNTTPSPESFKCYYAEQPRFIFDPNENGRIPVRIARRWQNLSRGLRIFFSANFSQQALHGQKDRVDYKTYLLLAE